MFPSLWSYLKFCAFSWVMLSRWVRCLEVILVSVSNEMILLSRVIALDL